MLAECASQCDVTREYNRDLVKLNGRVLGSIPAPRLRQDRDVHIGYAEQLISLLDIPESCWSRHIPALS